MKLKRTLAFTRRALLQFRHDRRTLAFILVMPLLMILIFGFTFGGEVKNLKVEVVNLDKGMISSPFSVSMNSLNISDRIENELDTDVLSIHMSGDVSASKKLVDEGNAWAAIIFPENFTVDFIRYAEKVAGAVKPAIEVYLDGSNPQIAGTIISTVNEAALDALNSVAMELNMVTNEVPLTVSPDYAYGGGNTEFIDYFAPGIIAFAIMMVTVMITIILFVNERRNGTLNRLLASPASESEIVLGYALAFAIIGVIQSAVILTAAILIFNISIVGNVVLAFLVTILIGVGHQGLGILLSAGAKNELQAVQFVPLIIFPSVLLAGLFWPLESIPSFLQPLAYFVPLKYGIDAERSIMLRGWGLEQIWLDIAVLGIFAVLTLTGSVLLLRKRD